MITRRSMMQSMAASLLAGTARAQDRYDQQALLHVPYPGDLTLLHIGDLHGMTAPHYLRPAALRAGAADPVFGAGEMFRARFGVGGQGPLDYALTHESFDSLAPHYGPMGGLAQLATVVRSVRAAQPPVAVLSGGVLSEAAQVALAPDAHPSGGTEVLPLANRSLVVLKAGPGPIDIGALRQQVAAARREAGEGPPPVVVLLSARDHRRDQALAQAEIGIDVICSAGGDLALPEPVRIGGALLLASGHQGRFVTRLDLDVDETGILRARHRLIPIFSDLMHPAHDVQMPQAPHDAPSLAQSRVTLHHRDLTGGTWAALLGRVMREATGAEIALMPPLSGLADVWPGQPVTTAHVALAAGRAGVRRVEMRGAEIKARLEASAWQVLGSAAEEGDPARLLRTAGVAFSLVPDGPRDGRIRDLRRAGGAGADGAPIQPEATYAVALRTPSGGQPLAPLLRAHLQAHGVGSPTPDQVTIAQDSAAIAPPGRSLRPPAARGRARP